MTRRFLQAAGIGTGMKVLDIGSGAGDVALLLADLVGLEGSGRRRRHERRHPGNGALSRRRCGMAQRFVDSWRCEEIDLGSDFDAAVGRWILMYLPDPAAMLRHLATRVRTGGIVAFHENDFTYPPAVFPPTELWGQMQRWMIPKPGSESRAEMRMGTKLFASYLDAGLPAPHLIVEAPVGAAPIGRVTTTRSRPSAA